MQYSNIVMAKMRDEYILSFNEKWTSFLNGFNMKYTSSKQLNIGNRIRPYLVLWGFALGKESFTSDSFDFCAELSISFEGIHKASVIIDDIVDGDNKRRGEKCMHVEYGEYEAIFFAVCLLSKSINNINMFLQNHENVSLRCSAVTMLCDIIFNMCTGALKEISTDERQRKNLKHIQEIIQLETVSLLKNCLLIGFLASGSRHSSKELLIKNIGQKCGYIFQVANDLEPFCNVDHVIKHKGDLNSDVLRSRKNIVIPYLYATASTEDKKNIDTYLKQSNFAGLMDLFNKYQIMQIIISNIDDLFDSITSLILDLEHCFITQNKLLCLSFSSFIEYLKEYYLSILGKQ